MFSGKSILIVEGNAFLAIDLAMAVEAVDGEVVGPVASVPEALILIDSFTLSAAVLDWQLHDQDVAPVINALVRQGVPLVIQSVVAIPATISAAHPTVPVLRKPHRSSVVLEVLAEAIETRERGGHAKWIRSIA